MTDSFFQCRWLNEFDGRQCARTTRSWFCTQHWSIAEKLVDAHRREELLLYWNLRLEEPEEPGYWKKGLVYFVQRQDGAVKIGTSIRLRERLITLEREFGPLTILAVVKGGFEEEQVLHQKFWRSRLWRGEWFELSDELNQFIQGHRIGSTLNCHRAVDAD